jgi:hypothetical protein
MASQATHSAEHVLYVTGPVRERLYEHFSDLFQGRDDVEVRIDRRLAERRRDPRGPQKAERRSGDRRRVRPEWIVPPPEDL